MAQLKTDGGAIEDRWWRNWRPILKTVSNCATFDLGKILQNINKNFGGVIEDRFWKRSRITPPVAQLKTVSKNGLELRHRWRNWRPILKTVSNCATFDLGKILQNLNKNFGGVIEDRFWKRSWIAPPVALLKTVSKNGLELCHQWRNWRPFLKTVSNYATGGAIEDRFEKRSLIAPPVAQLKTDVWKRSRIYPRARAPAHDPIAAYLQKK